jgi:hypothetical protein
MPSSESNGPPSVFEISVVELTWAEWARAEVERWPAARMPADGQALERLIAGLLEQIPPPVAGEDGSSAV